MWSSGFYCPAEQDDDAFLRRLFADCMERLPAGARGRPMAPSDVVELERDGRRTYYYVSDKGEMVQVKFSPLLAKKAAQDGGSLS